MSYAPRQPLDPPADEVYATVDYWKARAERAEADADRLARLVYPGATNTLKAHDEAVAQR